MIVRRRITCHGRTKGLLLADFGAYKSALTFIAFAAISEVINLRVALFYLTCYCFTRKSRVCVNFLLFASITFDETRLPNIIFGKIWIFLDFSTILRT